MTRSLTKEQFTPFEDPEREFHLSRKLFKTLSLDESSSPEFDLSFDLKENFKGEIAEMMTKTIEECARPEELRNNTFNGSNHEDANEHTEKFLEIVDLFYILEITQDQIMLQDLPIPLTGAVNRWLKNEPSAKKMEEINNFQQEPNETLYRAWERFKELLMRCPQCYLMDMQEVILFYNGLEVPTRQILDSKGAIPTMTAANAKIAIQEMAEHS
nr:hypothetical protein [Tanacetum cinerariifolium]